MNGIEVAAEIGATPMQTALAWLLHRALNILLIPGTSSVKHFRENLTAAELSLSEDALARLTESAKIEVRYGGERQFGTPAPTIA